LATNGTRKAKELVAMAARIFSGVDLSWDRESPGRSRIAKTNSKAVSVVLFVEVNIGLILPYGFCTDRHALARSNMAERSR
jgi:hypothetical protein